MGLLGKKTATATAGDGGSASPTGGNVSGGGMMGSMLRQMIDSGQITGPKPISATGIKLDLVDDKFEGMSLKKGGKVKRTGKALVHKGEVVLTASKVKMLKKLLH